jgi:dihydroxyacetone kinase-like protein
MVRFEEAGQAATAAAKAGVESTKGMVATKGRAYYVRQRSLGHPDPGAVSIYLLLDALCKPQQ